MIRNSPAALIQVIARLSRNYLSRRLAAHGIHPGQDQLLLLLWDQPGLRPGELARQLDVDPATVTTILTRLERVGLIQRLPDPDDRRSWRIHPTQRSRTLEPIVRSAWHELNQEIGLAAHQADPGELQRLLTALRERLEIRD